MGALGESIARKLGVGEFLGREIITSLCRNLLAFGIRPINCVPQRYEDLNRIIAVKITKGIPYPNPKDIFGSYDSPARGKTILVSLDDNSPTLRFFLVFKEPQIEFRENNLELDENYFWRIHRLGSKESRVSAVNVKRRDGVAAEKGKAISKFSFPVVKGVQPKEKLQESWFYETYTSFKDISYSEKANPVLTYLREESLIPFLIPILITRAGEPEFIVDVSDPAAFYRIDEEIVIGWKG